MMVGKKQLKHLSILRYSRILADAARIFETSGLAESGSTNMITVNCTIGIIEPLSAVTILFLVS
jgi:hypothetical protein